MGKKGNTTISGTSVDDIYNKILNAYLEQEQKKAVLYGKRKSKAQAVEDVRWKGWKGDSDLIMSQEYIAKVFVESAFGELLKDIEIGNLQSLDKIAWRIREILGDSQSVSDKETKGEA